jgi:hypothetical protein
MYWIVGPTYDLGEKEFRQVWDDMIIKMRMGRDKRIKRAYNKKQGNMWIQFPWNTRLEVRSADHPENLVGEALDWVIMSEAAKHKSETWERFIRPALADKRGGADFATTPEGFNWLHDEWMRGNNPDFPDYESWSFPSWANTAVYPGGREDSEIKLLEQTTMPEWFMQEIGADFASFVGKIFPEWDEHSMVRNVLYDDTLPNYIAFDWGYTNPLAAVEFQIDREDRICVWRVHYQSFKTIPDNIEMMQRRDQPPNYHIDLTFGDAADPEAAVTVARLLNVPCLAMPECKSDYSWREGIDLIRSFMQARENLYGLMVIDEYGTPKEEEPGFFIDFTCTDMIKEFNNYRSNEAIKGKNVPEWGQKMADHTIDAMRYALVHIYKLGCLSSLADIYPPNAGPPPGYSRDSIPLTGKHASDLAAEPSGSQETYVSELDPGDSELILAGADMFGGEGRGFGNMTGKEF